MECGNIVEYIDRQKILCAVILEIKNKRLRLLTENNREVKLSASRLLHRDHVRLDLSQGRDRMVDALKQVADKRRALIRQVDVHDLWDVLNTEQVWIDLETMTEFCFPENPSGDHESAVIRALFDDRLYFKFNPDRFFPHSAEQVERLQAQQREQARRDRIVERGSQWLKQVLADKEPAAGIDAAEIKEYVRLLKSYYLFGKESREHVLTRTLLARAGLDATVDLFPVLVRLKVFEEDENIELLRCEIPVQFPAPVLQSARRLVAAGVADRPDDGRVDLTQLPLMTIDGQATLDFDDALSIESLPDGGYRLGIHIADVGHFVRKGDEIDEQARERGSSIYMPDQKIPMLPPDLAEGLCSLKAGQVRPAISTLVKLSPSLEIIDHEIVASWVSVKDQLIYYDVNLVVDQNPQLAVLHKIAEKFRRQRFDAGAVQISVPEINVWLTADRTINVNKVSRESPARMLVAELMILANWLMAKFLVDKAIPAVFRTQPEPRERLYQNDEGSLFQNWMQRRLLSRFVLDNRPGKHSGLGVEAYVTATSPIRKYFDLVTQRQIRAALGLEQPYSMEDIDQIIQSLEQPMGNVARVQYSRHRYWLLKYLEGRVGAKEEAIVLGKRRNGYQILLTGYMIECDLPSTAGLTLKPEDLIQVTIQKVSARNDQILVFIG